MRRVDDLEVEEKQESSDAQESTYAWEVFAFQFGICFVALMVLFIATSSSLNAYYNALFSIGTIMLYIITGYYFSIIFPKEDNLKEKNMLLLLNIGSIIVYVCTATKISIQFIGFLVLNFGSIVTLIRSLKDERIIITIYLFYLPIFIALLIVFFYVRSTI